LNDAQNGEYFRNIVAYGAIGLSLVLYAWKQANHAQNKAMRPEGDDASPATIDLSADTE
jgi:hypothetical protein